MELNLDSKGDWNKQAADAMRGERTASSTGQSTSSGDPNTPASHRKERGAIAAQACDTCRSRKQRCDEQRPKCGTCQKFKLECNYREPQPTKKDRTLMEILDRIKGLESKIDSLKGPFPDGNYHSQTAPNHSSSSGAPPSVTVSPGVAEPASTPFHMTDLRPRESRNASLGQGDGYVYASSATQMMAWPALQRILQPIKDKAPGFSPATIDQDGPKIVLGSHEQHRRARLSADGTMGQMRTIGPISMQAPGGLPVRLDTLTWETMQRLSKAYFDSINFLYPLVDREVFNIEIMPSIAQDGFSESMPSTIALLVFALGELVISGSEGIPIHVYKGRQSGLRGGTGSEPPGLALFNEARKRLGFNLTECSVENIQAYALTGLYYGAACHNTEQWRMTSCASMAVEALMSSKPSEMSSPRGDLIRRAFWHCSMMETCVVLELGMPTTALEKLEQMVGLPDFSESLAEEDYLGNQSTHFQEHFASQIVLRRLMMDFHNAMGQGPSPHPSPEPMGSPSVPSGSSPASSSALKSADIATIKQHTHQLEQWRGMLPVPLRWQEDSPGAFPAQDPTPDIYQAAGFPAPAATSSAHRRPGSPSLSRQHHHQHHHSRSASSVQAAHSLMFTTALDAPSTPYPFAYDIQVALLRTRYYYAKYLFHRPYLYKVLHSPADTLTSDDAAGAATCLRAALKWPVTMSPACKRKRLIPCLYFWTQNVFGVLLVLHLARTHPLLQRIVRAGLCGETWEADAAVTAELYIDWLRDLAEADPASAFGYSVVKAVYGLDDGPAVQDGWRTDPLEMMNDNR